MQPSRTGWRGSGAAFWACLIALGLGLAHAAQAQDRTPPGETLELRFLDVGQADAALIRLGRRAVLVDAGRGDDIVQVLEELGIDSLVAAITSHNHDDHLGGMDAVLADYPVGQYFDNGRTPTNANARSVQDVLARRQVPRPPPPWPPFQLGDARVTVFPTSLGADSASENNSSLGVLVERGGFKALFTGDSEVEELNAWMGEGLIPDVDVLKAAHHGARNGVTPGWVNVTRPEVVVISVGAGNSYGHPDPWALRYYAVHQARVFRTDLDGTVVVTVDGVGNYEVRTLGARVRE